MAMRVAIIIVVLTGVCLGGVVLFMNWRDRVLQRDFVHRVDAIALGTPLEVASSQLGSRSLVRSIGGESKQNCVSPPVYKAVVPSPRGRMAAVFYLDGDRKVVCKELLGPMVD